MNDSLITPYILPLFYIVNDSPPPPLQYIGAWYVLQKFRTSSNCMMENVTSEGEDYYVTENLEPVGVTL